MSQFTKTTAAFGLMDEMRTMLNDIAASAAILGATPFAGGPAAKALAMHLHTVLLEFEIAMAEIGRHQFAVKQECVSG